MRFISFFHINISSIEFTIYHTLHVKYTTQPLEFGNKI